MMSLPGSGVANDFAQLRQRVQEAGLLKSRPLYYVWQVMWCVSLLASVFVILVLTNSLWVRLLDAVLLAFAGGQIALLGHDAGHRQIRSTTGTVILYLAAFCTGISAMCWQVVHNAHHAHPNRDEMDPDIEQPLFAYSEEQVLLRKWRVAQFTIRHQEYLYFPLLMFTGWSLRKTGMEFLRERNFRETWLDWMSFALHFALYFIILFALLPPLQAVFFIVVHQMSWGLYLGSIFAPNHKGMDMVDKNQKIDFLREQVLTARNVRPGFFTDIFYGGLNYQIEHHLFPAMPRCNLGRARVFVREHCAKLGVSYHETSIPRSYVEILSHMRSVAQFARNHKTQHAALMWQARGELRSSVLSSVSAARAELTTATAAFVQSRLSDAQKAHVSQLHQEAVFKLDNIREAVSRSAHMKRAKLLQYQKEVAKTVEEWKSRWAVATGSMVTV